jgi:hypothetical protein
VRANLLEGRGIVEGQAGQQRPIELRLSASEFLDRVALLTPPPRKHRHRYVGVLALNSPWREVVTAQAGRNGVRRASSGAREIGDVAGAAERELLGGTRASKAGRVAVLLKQLSASVTR